MTEKVFCKENATNEEYLSRTQKPVESICDPAETYNLRGKSVIGKYLER